MSPDDATRHWPVEIRANSRDRVLDIVFDNGERFSLPAELLRVESPSAEVRGHGQGHRITVAGKRLVGIAAVEQVGNYAVRIRFDDGHDTGIFTWRYLHELGTRQETIWKRYLDRLESEGLSREP